MNNLSQAMNEYKQHRDRKAQQKAEAIKAILEQNPTAEIFELSKPSASAAAEQVLRAQEEEDLRAALTWIKTQPASVETSAIYKLLCGALAWTQEHDYKQLKLF